MKMNPIYKRETMVSARSFRLALILMVFNGILAAVALLNMYSVITQVKMTAEIQYSSFLEIYIFVSSIEFMLLMFIMPALTAGSISGERERQTLELILTTKMKPMEIVLGKLFSCFSTMFLLILSSFPVLALVFVYGGITQTDLLALLVCYATVALYSGSLGICCSSLFKKSTMATAVSYGVIILIVAGTYAVNLFSLSMSRMNMNSYMNSISDVTEKANSGGCLYLLLLNPVVTFYLMINGQAGSSQHFNEIGRWFGARQSNPIIDHWVPVSIAVQLILVVVFLAAAIRALNPVRRPRRLKRPMPPAKAV